MSSTPVTIIIPIYNGEAYIQRCMNSIKQQTHPLFEVVLVDDGSQDNTAAMCDKIAQEDSRFVVYHKQNGGVSSARNLGIEKANCELLTFIDVDDYIEPEYLEHLLRYDADIVIGGVKILSPREKTIVYEDVICTVADAAHYIQRNLYTTPMATPWAKLFKRRIILQEHLRFDNRIKYTEDTIFLFEYMSHCKTFAFISTTDYCYFYNGQQKYSMGNEDIVFRANRMIKAYDALRDHCKLGDGWQTTQLHKILKLIILNERQRPFSVLGYSDFKDTILGLPDLKKYYPNCAKPNFLYKLLRDEHFLVAFFIIRFILPFVKIK